MLSVAKLKAEATRIEIESELECQTKVHLHVVQYVVLCIFEYALLTVAIHVSFIHHIKKPLNIHNIINMIVLQMQEAEIQFLKEQNELEISKAKELSEIEVSGCNL